MCLNKEYKTKKGAQEAHLNPSIAKEDIKVYKMLTIIKDKAGREKLKGKAPYRDNLVYHKGKEYSAKFSSYSYGNTFIVRKGLHAFTNKKMAKSECSYYNYTNKFFVEMCIPKGSQYYKGTNGEIVSNKLIWK